MSVNSLNEEAIFRIAAEISSKEARSEYLDQACGDHEALLNRVLILLRAHDESASFLESPPPGIAVTALASPTTELTGDKIGPYKLLQQIGEGGMGVVYMAEQTEPIKRQVALKIIRPGMGTRQVIARFEAERQALAMMDHPHIAKAFDAGVTNSGRPYFVMELVKGVPITDYCDQHRLGLRERLQLFMPVCQAIQHAHQKGIIHRDIKPSNVLVANYDDHAVPKVIDFGVAKAVDHRLTEKTMFTEVGQVLGTIEYMSPEQAKLNQLDVDTRSDIYSLGVLLYELLVGETPFDRKRLRSAAFDELLRIIREEEPPAPSSRLSTSATLPSIASNRQSEPKRLCTVVRGELDWIVMKALEKDRTRRYATANGLRADVERYLEGDPITAAPPGNLYRLTKFVRRHRVVAATSFLIAASLLLAIVGTSIGMVRAYNAKARADAEAHAAELARGRAESAREQATYWQYASSIPAADSFLNENATATATARNILRNSPAEQRDFEWALLANRAWPPFAAQVAVEMDSIPDDAQASEFWKADTVKVVQELFPAENRGGLNTGYFAPDGRSIFFSLANGLVKEISTTNDETIATYSSEAGNSMDVVLSPTGTRLAGFTFSNRGTVWTVGREGQTVAGEPTLRGPPWICRWSPDEKYLITGHMNGTLRVWDAVSLALVADWADHQSEITDIYMPQAADFVWSASNDGTIIKRSCPDGVIDTTFKIPVAGELEYQAISPHGSLACAVYRDGSHLIWNIEEEKVSVRLAGPSDDPNIDQPRIACNFSPDESCVAVMTSNQRAAVYDVASGELLNRIPGDGLPLRMIRFSPGGKLILTLSFGGRAQLWTSTDTQRPQLANAHKDVVYQIDVDAKRRLLLLGSYDSTASIWNLRTNRQLKVYTGHEAQIMAVDLHPELPLAATLDASGKIHVWNTSTASLEYEITPDSDEFANHLGRSGKIIRANLLNFPASLSTGIFTPDGSRIVAHHQGRMKVFDARTGEWTGELESATFSGWPVYSYDSSLVAILEMYGKNLGVWDIETGALLHRSIEQNEAMVMIDFSPVDLRLVTGAMEAGVNIWNAKTGEIDRTLEVQSGNAVSCHFSRDGQYVLTGSGDGTARMWDSKTGELVTTLVGHSNRVRDVRLNADQTRLLSWSMDDRAIIWDMSGPYANQLLVLSGESKLIHARWTDDGRDIITAWSDGKVEIWRGASKSDIASLQAGEGNFEEAFTAWQKEHTNTLPR
jgi:serine/threonine protein kinase/WD40 repeat protein